MSQAWASSAALLPAARALREAKASLAERANDEFFRRHPEWVERFGERGRQRGAQDAAYLVEFLASALEAGLVPAFEDYIRWTVRVLGARGIDARFVAESVEVMGGALRERLGPKELAAAEPFLAAGCAAAVAVPTAHPEAAPGGLALERRLFTLAILAGQRKSALGIALEALRSGAGVLDVYADVLQESMYEVGRLWEANRITVAREHMATAIVQYILARLYAELPPAAESRGSAVVTCVEGELHQVGANMVADALEADGWSVQFLGADVPQAGVIAAIVELGASVVGISASTLTSVPRARALVAAMREHVRVGAVRVIVGGAIFARFPELVRDVGADGTALDVRAAVAAFRTAAASG